MKFLEVDGLNIENSALPVVQRTPEGRAMGFIPGWKSMIDANYMPEIIPTEGMSVLDRVQFKNIYALVGQNADIKPILIDGPNGNKLLDCVNPRLAQFDPGIDIPADEWSIFSVFVPSSLVTGDYRTRNYIKQVPEGSGLCTQISFSIISGAINVYGQSGNGAGITARLSSRTGVLVVDQLNLLVVTFSTKLGFKIFVNGKLVGESLTDTTPDSIGRLAGSYRMHRFFRGHLGMTGMLGIDLGSTKNQDFRKAIEGFLMSKYRISPAG